MIPFTRFFATAAVTTAVMFATGGAWAGATLDRVHQTKVIKVATAANWPPQSFLGPDNKLQGFDIDVANEIGKRLGSKAEFVTPEYGVITAEPPLRLRLPRFPRQSRPCRKPRTPDSTALHRPAGKQRRRHALALHPRAQHPERAHPAVPEQQRRPCDQAMGV